MPKVRRTRINTHHEHSVRIDKRQFALPGKAEPVAIGAETDVPAMDLLDTMESSDKIVLKKKEKQQLKHELFLQRLESSHTPYSKSHARRLKRKAREQIASGLQDVALALPEVEEEPIKELKDKGNTDHMKSSSVEQPKLPRRRDAGLIGEGKGATLTEKQRRQILKTEKIRQPLLLATPEFAENPFKALRIHAQNTLVKHEKS